MNFSYFDYSGRSSRPESFKVHSFVPEVHLDSRGSANSVVSKLTQHGKCMLIDCYGMCLRDSVVKTLCNDEKELIVCLTTDSVRKNLLINVYSDWTRCVGEIVAFKTEPTARVLVLTYEELHVSLTANRRTIADLFSNTIFCCFEYREPCIYAGILSEIFLSRDSTYRCLFHSRLDEFQFRLNSSISGNTDYAVEDVPTSSKKMSAYMHGLLKRLTGRVLLLLDDGFPYRRALIKDAVESLGFSWFSVSDDASVQAERTVDAICRANLESRSVLCLPSKYRDGIGFLPDLVVDSSMIASGKTLRSATEAELYVAYGRLGRSQASRRYRYIRFATEVQSVPTPDENDREEALKAYFVELDDSIVCRLASRYNQVPIATTKVESLSVIPESRVTRSKGFKLLAILDRSSTHRRLQNQINQYNDTVELLDEIGDALRTASHEELSADLKPADCLADTLTNIVDRINCYQTEDKSAILKTLSDANVAHEIVVLDYRSKRDKFNIAETARVLELISKQDLKATIDSVNNKVVSSTDLWNLAESITDGIFTTRLEEWCPPD